MTDAHVINLGRSWLRGGLTHITSEEQFVGDVSVVYDVDKDVVRASLARAIELEQRIDREESV